MQNPLLRDLSAIPAYADIRPEHVSPAIDTVLAEVRPQITELAAQNAISWKEWMEPLTACLEKVEQVWRPVSHLHHVADTEALRQAYQENLPKLVTFSLEVSQNEALYDKLCQLQQDPSLSAVQNRVVALKVQEATLMGVGLSAEKKTRFSELEQQLNHLQTEFSNHVLDATKAFSHLIYDKKDLDGLSPEWCALASARYQAKEAKPTTPEAGPWLASLESSAYVPVLENATNRALRETLYRASITKASSGDYDNTPLIHAILLARKEQAEILGFPSFAALSLSQKMASSVDKVLELETSLRERAWKKAEEEQQTLETFAQQHGATLPLVNWDIPFWAKRLEEKEAGLSEDDLKPYFALPRVLEGLFALANVLFDIEVRPSTEPISVWQKDVRFYEVWEKGIRVAGFFLDPYSRPADKQPGAWMDVCRGRQALLWPVAHLTCNFTPPVGTEPSLLTFREVETLFHEFGHGLQHMLTLVEYPQVAGIHGVEWDAVELPSQFMENWCYHRSTLLHLAKHHETGASLPEGWFEQLYRNRNFRVANGTLRQGYFGVMDLFLHHEYVPMKPEGIFEVQRTLAQQYSLVQPLPEDRFLCAFSHIFGGGYAAGYYSYKWAEVLSADAFGAFEEAGLEDAAALRTVGSRFRHTVLALGGSVPPGDVFVAFRGREPQIDALLRHGGLS